MMFIKSGLIVLIILAAFLIRTVRYADSNVEIIRSGDGSIGTETVTEEPDDASIKDSSKDAETVGAGAGDINSQGDSMDLIYVDISGEVNKPGVYEVHEGTRLLKLSSLQEV